MREIKLQAWQKQRKELFEVSAIQFASPTKPGFVVKKALSGGLNIETWTLDEVELREFTGLKDKIGKEVYEGDIVSVEEEGQGVVTWGAFSDCCVEGETWLLFPDRWQPTLYSSIAEAEVIGNIYENSDLLSHEER